MKKILVALVAILACVCVHAQTASTVVSGSTITTQVTDAAGNIYTVATPFTLSMQAGSPSLVVTPVVVVPPPPPPPPPPPSAPSIPSNAIATNLITATNWKACEHDAGTPGTGTCSSNYPVSGIFADDARAFSMAYTNGGGLRWAISFAKDTASTNFVLDGVFQSPNWAYVADLELDTNQVKADGKTAILGTQCASQEKTWDITLSNSTGAWHWVKTNVPCNPMTWAPNVPHHIRIFGTIDASDVSTYLGVEFDGVYSPFISATGPTGNALKWGIGSVLTNVQIDGYKTAGSATVYSDKLTIYRW